MYRHILYIGTCNLLFPLIDVQVVVHMLLVLIYWLHTLFQHSCKLNYTIMSMRGHLKLWHLQSSVMKVMNYHKFKCQKALLHLK